MVQPVSAILILIGLGFRFYSRQSIIYGSTRPPSFSLFVPAHCASSTSSSYSSFHLVCCFDILSRLFRFLMAFYSLPFGVSCCVPHCRFDSWLYLSRCYVTVGWRSQQNFTLYCSVVRLGQSPASVLLLSFLQPFEPRHPSLSIGYHLRLRSCQCLHGFAIVFPLFQYRIPAD